VENTGHRPGKTVAQLYLSPPRRSPWPPRELRAFQKIHLQPGEKALVIFSLAERELETFDPDRQEWMVHPGRYTVHTGAHSRSLQKADFEISAD
jgi:beta-glucosidase